MDSGDAGFFFVLIIFFVIAVMMMVHGFSKENQDKIREAHKEFLSDAIEEGIRKAKEDENNANPR